MAPHSASTPNLESGSDDVVDVFISSRIRKWATSEFADAFNLLPDHSKVDFVDLTTVMNSEATYPEKFWPHNAASSAVVIGTFDPEKEAHKSVGRKGDKIIALLDTKNVTLSYQCYSTIDSCYTRLSVRNHNRYIEFQGPFASVCGDTSWNKASKMLRALVVWYMVAAGQVEEVPLYKTFESHFQQACSYIAQVGLSDSSTLDTENDDISEPEAKQGEGGTVEAESHNTTHLSSRGQAASFEPLPPVSEQRRTRKQHESNDNTELQSWSLPLSLSLCYVANSNLETAKRSRRMDNVSYRQVNHPNI
jgi:hypothetical protein